MRICTFQQNFSNALLCNVLEVMMKPNFESPAHTASDLVERDITLFVTQVGYVWEQWLLKSSREEYRKIGENMIITKSKAQYYEMTKNEMLNQGTHAKMASVQWVLASVGGRLLTEYDEYLGKYKLNYGRGYYKGGKLSGMIPAAGHLTNKKWHLNEVDIHHSHCCHYIYILGLFCVQGQGMLAIC